MRNFVTIGFDHSGILGVLNISSSLKCGILSAQVAEILNQVEKIWH